MRKSQKTAWQFKGEITAFLSLLFLLMLSLVAALLESASIQIARSRKRADVNLALESVFAEYHGELLHTYDLFARFGSDEATMRNRLEYYGAGNMNHSLTKVKLLTDDQGEVYYRQAVQYVKHQLGIEAEIPGGKYDFDEGFSYEGTRDGIFANLDGLLEEEKQGLAKEDNPLDWAKNLKGTGLLSLLVAEKGSLSNQTLATETLPSHRSLQQGNAKEEEPGGAGDMLFFLAYLTEHFSDYTKGETGKALFYEQEYLLEGGETDRENLEAVCKKILNIRMAANYAYILTDTGRQAEAEAMAATLCSLVLNPEITPVVKQALLLVWAYGESVVDVRALLKQKKVPAMKSSDTWQLQLANVTKLGTSKEISGEKEYESGLSYQDYLKGLLLLEKKENLCMRSLDLIEANLHIKTDQCMTKATIETTVKLRRGVQDTFVTTFKYQ